MILHEPPVRVWHHAWEKNAKAGNVGLMMAEYTTPGGEAYAWIVPPGAERPLTFRRSAIEGVDS